MVSSCNRVLFLLLISLVCMIQSSYSWSQEELDLFDLVEEVNEDFYTFLQVSQDAPLSDIKRAYRKLSLQYHPDKNRDDPNASEIFRKLGAVADVLKDEEMRAMYDSVLEYGLPDWRQPVYYYRRVRKMSMIELSILLMIVIVIGQLLYGWAVYAEKQLVLYELRQRKEKKDRKAKGRKSGTINTSQLDSELLYHEAMAKAALPHYTKLFPVVLVKKTIHYSLVLYYVVGMLIQKLRKSKNEEQENEVVENEQSQSTNKHSSKRRRNEVTKAEKEPSTTTDHISANGSTLPNKAIIHENVIDDHEEEDDEERKALLMEKEKELEAELEQLEENLMEEENWTTKKSKHSKRPHSNKIKSPLADKSIEYQQNQVETNPDDKSQWSQYQQTQLELALKKYDKDEENRWDLIAEFVPDKTKEECIVRYKELVELVRKRKAQ